MDISDLIENIYHINNKFADEKVAERTKVKMSIPGLSPESEGKNSENVAAGETKCGGFPKKGNDLSEAFAALITF